MTIAQIDTRTRLGLHLRDGVEALDGAAGALRVGCPATGWLTLRNPGPGIRAVLAALAAGPVTEVDLAGEVIAFDGDSGVLSMHLLLARLGAAGLLTHVLDRGGDRIARLRVVGQGGIVLPGRPDPAAPVVLDRFAIISASGGALVARAPRNALALDLYPGALAVLGGLAAGSTPAELEQQSGIEQPGIAALLRMLGAAGLLAPPGPESVARQQWAPADLWLHARSRGPRTVAGYGGSYVGRGRRQPEPAVPAAGGGRRVPLPVPDLAAVADRDPRLTDVLERRRSVRLQDSETPIAATQLGELLYRSARTRRQFPGSDGEQVADRPYPSGGAVHELEIYPLVTDCRGIDAGLWHYRTDDHTLELIAEPGPLLDTLVARARAAAVMTADPQVVLLVTARFGRVMFKYETIGYALIAKHVGVLYQTLYLVATAMDLAICGLGGGDADTFAAASGLDYLLEGTVGELVLGSRPPGPDANDAWSGEDAQP
jgi:SagB-type dehydrogenase family enzyme